MVSIRRLQKEDDFNELIALSREFFEEYEAHHEAFFKIDRLRDSDIVEYFSRSVDSEDGRTFVAITNGSVVGYITLFIRSQPDFYMIKKVGAISGLMIHKDYRRKGIASRLLAEAAAFFEGKGVEYFTVYTATTNQAALKLYERNGMTPLYATMLGRTGKNPKETATLCSQ